MRKTALLLLLWMFGHTLVIIGDGLTDEVFEADLAIVLGNKVHPDGTPSPRLVARLSRGLELYEDGQVKALLVTGATGKEGPDEALVMRQWLVDAGVPPEAILVDSGGINTYHSAKNARVLMQAHGFASVIAVSHYYHLTRTKLALRRAGIQTVGAAHARGGPELRDPYSILREVVGYYVYLVRSY